MTNLPSPSNSPSPSTTRSAPGGTPSPSTSWSPTATAVVAARTVGMSVLIALPAAASAAPELKAALAAFVVGWLGLDAATTSFTVAATPDRSALSFNLLVNTSAVPVYNPYARRRRLEAVPSAAEAAAALDSLAAARASDGSLTLGLASSGLALSMGFASAEDAAAAVAPQSAAPAVAAPPTPAPSLPPSALLIASTLSFAGASCASPAFSSGFVPAEWSRHVAGALAPGALAQAELAVAIAAPVQAGAACQLRMAFDGSVLGPLLGLPASRALAACASAAAIAARLTSGASPDALCLHAPPNPFSRAGLCTGAGGGAAASFTQAAAASLVSACTEASGGAGASAPSASPAAAPAADSAGSSSLAPSVLGGIIGGVLGGVVLVGALAAAAAYHFSLAAPGAKPLAGGALARPAGVQLRLPVV